MRVVILALGILAAWPAHAEIASFYGGERHHNLCGSRTASGERYDCSAMTASMRFWHGKPVPFGTWVRVTRNGRSVTVRINDRGPFVRGRDIDLSMAAARRIGCGGVCRVQLQISERPYHPKRGDWGFF